MIAPGARVLIGLLAAVGGGTALLSLLVGLLAGGSASRSIAVGFYAVGAFCALAGFALGTQSSWRHAARPGRSSSPARARESRALAALLILVGLVLVVAGVAVDPRVRLV